MNRGTTEEIIKYMGEADTTAKKGKRSYQDSLQKNKWTQDRNRDSRI